MSAEQLGFNNEGGKPESTIAFIWDLIKVFVISMFIVLTVHHLIAQPFIVSGSSMEPNFHTGECLIIDELSYRFEDPKRGDIVVFKYPKDNKQYFIKRIIGLPGEKIRIENGQVRVFNSEKPEGFVLDEPYLKEGTSTFPIAKPEQSLGSSEYYVLGDNRTASSDSRFWGPVPKKNIVGRAFVRAFPFSELEKFESIEYTTN